MSESGVLMLVLRTRAAWAGQTGEPERSEQETIWQCAAAVRKEVEADRDLSVRVRRDLLAVVDACCGHDHDDASPRTGSLPVFRVSPSPRATPPELLARLASVVRDTLKTDATLDPAGRRVLLHVADACDRRDAAEPFSGIQQLIQAYGDREPAVATISWPPPERPIRVRTHGVEYETEPPWDAWTDWIDRHPTTSRMPIGFHHPDDFRDRDERDGEGEA